MQSLKNKLSRGVFITLEGSEAVGKSTIIQKIADFLTKNHIDYIQTREPGGTLLAEKIRTLIFDDTLPHSQMTELLLLFAARRDHIERVIRPALDANKIVLCDRYIDSSYVYQSLIHTIPEKMIDSLVDDFIKPTLPDVCFIIDCDGETSFTRIQKRGIQNHNDDKPIAYFNHLRNGFLKRAALNTDYPYVIIDNTDLQISVTKIIDYLQENILK
jgi:dTMP kinase